MSPDPTLLTVEERTYGVSELAGLIGRIVSQAFPASLWVQGQIRNLSRSANGHVYFDLAEPGPLGSAPAALVPVALLASDKAGVNAVMRSSGAGRMEDGVEVRIAGRLNWFTPRGRLQMRMTGIDPAFTLGRLLEDRDRLLAALRAEGLLTRNHERPLSAMPLRVGVVTSLGSAAHGDFLHELETSGFGFRLIEVDARTQGLDAAWSVSAAIAMLDRVGVDVVALVRGGGARTDLAPFDGEPIARAIAGCSVPVFSGIGHEMDRSIADEVAHSAHKTPTACAAALVAIVAAGVERAESTWAIIVDRAVTMIDRAETDLDHRSWRLARATTGALRAAERVVDSSSVRLVRETERALSRAEQRLTTADVRIRALDPATALARGWSITRDEHGSVVRSAAILEPGQRLVTALAEGSVTSTVESTRPGGNRA